MNWNLFALSLFFLAVFFLISVSLLFYIRHWASRHAGYSGAAETEGVYFKRYVPEKLRSDYEKRPGSLHNSHDINHRSLWANLASVIVVLSVVVISVSSLIHNMDLFRSPIDLEPDEINKLDYTQHQWQRVTDNKLPDLPSVLEKMNMKGFIVPYSNKEIDSLINGVNLRQYALKHWRNFANRNQLYIKHCRWKVLIRCQRLYNDGIILVPPEYWDFELLDIALANGANVIAYGPPAQLFSDAKDKAIQWHGLTFEEVLKKAGDGLMLRGNQLLTLGFDAGLILKATSPF
ncbi:hypothetical protein KA005_59485, partial [bacterium]|nr:hypothetical protein [bacterium]